MNDPHLPPDFAPEPDAAIQHVRTKQHFDAIRSELHREQDRVQYYFEKCKVLAEEKADANSNNIKWFIVGIVTGMVIAWFAVAGLGEQLMQRINL